MPDPIRIDRSKMTPEARQMADTPVFAIDRRALHVDNWVVPLDTWGGARNAVDGTIHGAAGWPQFALRYDMTDGSSILLKLMTQADGITPIEVEQSAGGYPILKVLVLDNGLNRGHMADVAWQEVARYITGLIGDKIDSGVGGAAAIIGQSVKGSDRRRAHYWKLDI